MSMFDINSKMAVLMAMNIQSISTVTTTVGNVIDLNDVNNFEALELALQIGTFTDGTFAIVLEEADLLAGPFTAVVAEDIVGDNTPIGAANATSHIGYVGKKQFVRVSVVSVGVSGAAIVGVLAIEGHPRSVPLS